MPAFEKKLTIRFADTDAAGIAFYPRYFEMANNHIEDWFGEGLGFDFKHLHVDEGRAVPTAHIEVDFKAPGRMHEMLTLSLVLSHIGTTSIRFTLSAASEAEEKWAMRYVLVHMDMKTGKSLPWPDDMRAAMETWLPQGDTA
jgi:4-hydroxybenzoyl-CoA thioesterase